MFISAIQTIKSSVRLTSDYNIWVCQAFSISILSQFSPGLGFTITVIELCKQSVEGTAAAQPLAFPVLSITCLQMQALIPRQGGHAKILDVSGENAFKLLPFARKTCLPQNNR
jgi:hypothetical protein